MKTCLKFFLIIPLLFTLSVFFYSDQTLFAGPNDPDVGEAGSADSGIGDDHWEDREDMFESDERETPFAEADKEDTPAAGRASATAELKDEGLRLGDPKRNDQGDLEDPAFMGADPESGLGGSSTPDPKIEGSLPTATAEFKDEGSVLGAPKPNKEGGMDDPAFMGAGYDPESGLGSSSDGSKPMGGGPSARAEFKDEGVQVGAPKKDEEGNAEYPDGVTGSGPAPTSRYAGTGSTMEKGAPKKDDTSGDSGSSSDDKSDSGSDSGSSSDDNKDDKTEKSEKKDSADKDDKKSTGPIDPGDPAEGEGEGGADALDRYLPGGGGRSEEEKKSEERRSRFGREQEGNPAESSGRGGSAFQDPKSITGQPSLAEGGTLGGRREESITNLDSVINPEDR